MTQNNQPQAGVGGSQPPTVLLIRHALTALNLEKRIRAWSDVDIDMEKGRDDTMKTAEHLQGLPISEIVTSDLTRAEQTGQILANQLFLPTSNERALRPWNLGKFEAMKYDDVKDDITSYIKSPNKIVPGGEKFSDFLSRWKEGLSGLVARAMQSPTGMIAGVTHSRNIEATRYLLSGAKDVESLVKANSIPPSGVMALQVSNGSLSEVPFDNSHISKGDA